MRDSSPDLTLADLLQLLFKARLFMAGGAMIGILIAILLLSILPASYKATMIVAPADGYALGDYASSHGGSTSTYDKIVSLPFWRPMEMEGISTDFYRFVQTARGPSVATILLKDEMVRAQMTGEAQISPDYLAEYMARHVDIQPVGATPLRKLTYYHPDKNFAAAFLRKIHLVADQMIRRDRRRMAQTRIKYLTQSLEKNTNPDHRRIITGLLMQQEHILMLANLDEPYAAIIVEPAASSAQPAWPDTPMTVGGFALIGALCGFALWSWRRAAR